MTMEPTSLRSRRALLAGSIGALAAAAAQAIGRPLPAAAAGNAVILDDINSSTGSVPTTIARGLRSAVRFAQDSVAVASFVANDDAVAIYGESIAPGGVAVKAISNGHNTQAALIADGTEGNGEGYAIKAITRNGTAIDARCTGGIAIAAHGMTTFSRSGKVSFAAGQSTRTLTSGRVTRDTLVVATIQSDVAGTWVRNVTVNVSGQSFTIRLNKDAPKALKVGWFVVN